MTFIKFSSNQYNQKILKKSRENLYFLWVYEEYMFLTDKYGCKSLLLRFRVSERVVTEVGKRVAYNFQQQLRLGLGGQMASDVLRTDGKLRQREGPRNH